MSRMHYVYHIENKVNGTLYIGKGIEALRGNFRWTEHKRDARKKKTNMPIHRAIRKYGEENFIFTIMNMYETQEEALLSEIEYISYLRSQNIRLYNISAGGEGVSFKRGPRTPEHTSKLKCFPKGHIPWTKGKEIPIETRKKISKNAWGRKTSDSQRDEIKKLYAIGMTQKELSIKFGVGQDQISRIINDKTGWVARGRKNGK